MNRIINFVREKAFVLVLLACILAATATSIWAIRTVRQNLDGQNTVPNTEQDTEFGSFPKPQQQGDAIWDQQAGDVTTEMNGKVPMDGQTSQQQPAKPSSQSSGSASSIAPSEMPQKSEQPVAVATPSLVSPVSGAVQKEYSGDTLVYSETLGDWRTHNGVDYSAKLGETVVAPTSGKVITIGTEGNWGGVVEIEDSKGYLWRICGVDHSSLKAGLQVVAGQKIGEVSPISTEVAEPMHVHLEVKKDGRYQNPADFLS